MTSKKGVVWVLAVVFIFIVGWIVYSINQSPKWVGVSEDGNWKVEYDRDKTSPAGEWVGLIHWTGELGNEVQLMKIELIENDEVIHDLNYYDEDRLIEQNDDASLMRSIGSIFKDGKVKVQLKVYWEDKNGEHEDVIDVLPKKRFFVVPVLDDLENS
ncbi:hypothetical protein [Shouchella lonarensis]|uniref:DUF4944 domain-containing protein n=1 Tax=Shouchella lonarensis TaxID=1464122 RepID=A0A1G6HNE9_9BACI|nr:hypothetical protein [Shouchella lonarensis]SDB94976.1 hypothetical protein SAMN05421737_10457 [Shouchella lonarensis]